MADGKVEFAGAWNTICSDMKDYTEEKILEKSGLKKEDLTVGLLTNGRWGYSAYDISIFVYPLMNFELKQNVDGVLVSKQVHVRLIEIEGSLGVEATVWTKTSILEQPFAKKEKHIHKIKSEKPIPENYNKIIEFYPDKDDLSQYICELLTLSGINDDKFIINVNKRASVTEGFQVESEEGIHSLQTEGWDDPGNKEKQIKEWEEGVISRFGRCHWDFASQLEDYGPFYIENSRGGGVYWFFSKKKKF